jgi:hypothetical protein
MSKPLNGKEMEDYINTFVKNRNRHPVDGDTLQIINKTNFHQIEDNFEDEDFHIGFLGCLLCREEFKTFIALFIHMKINHHSYDIYHSSLTNQETKIKEAHVIVLTNNINEAEMNMTDDLCFFLVRNSKEERNEFISILKKFDIINLKDDNKFAATSTQQNNQTHSNNATNNQPNKNEKFKRYENNETNRIYFHTVTGGILNDDSDDSDYEIDEDDLSFLENKNIDSYTDICEKDKQFFKKWNKFIHNKR